MKKILICGATGFIGKNITFGLSKNKNYIIHAVRFKRPAYKTSTNVKWFQADLRNPSSVDKLMKGMDIVIQAAATTSGAKEIISKPYIHVNNNVIMNSVITKIAYDKFVKHVIIFSCTVMYRSSRKALKEKDFDILELSYWDYDNNSLRLDKIVDDYNKILEDDGFIYKKHLLD